MTLENYIQAKLYEYERMAEYSVATDTVRCLIDLYNEENNQQQKLSDKFKERIKNALFDMTLYSQEACSTIAENVIIRMSDYETNIES